MAARAKASIFRSRTSCALPSKLDAFGIHYIEGGWPGSNPKDIEFFAAGEAPQIQARASRRLRLTRRKGIAVEKDEQVRLLARSGNAVVTIVGKTWLLHVTEVLRTTPDENLAMIADTIRFLKDHGKIVIYDAEHASTATRTSRITPWPPGRPRKKPARIRRAVRHQRRLSCPTKSRDITAIGAKAS